VVEIITYKRKTKAAFCRECKRKIQNGERVYKFVDTSSHNPRYMHVHCMHERPETPVFEPAPVCNVFGSQAGHELQFDVTVKFAEKRDNAQVLNEVVPHGFIRTAYGYRSEKFGDLRNNQCFKTLLETIGGSGFLNIGVTVYNGYTENTAVWLRDNKLFKLIDGVTSVSIDGDTVTFWAGIRNWDSFRRLYLATRECTDTFNAKVGAWGCTEKTREKIAGTWAAKVNARVEKLLAKAPSYKG
jgi:hypothetical protein